MLKLYKRIKRVLHYHEAWAHGAKITEHWGKIGERGQSTEHKRNKKLSEQENLREVLAKPLSEGFKPVQLDEHATLLIEYAVDGMGTKNDLAKRHALEARMNETLGWTGLGNCDGGSIGSGTMDVCCFVVDFKVAKRVIEQDLKNTQFADYTRIYDERADPGPVPTAQGTGPLMPPWTMHDGLGREDAGWQNGKPTEYLTKWTAWYQSIPAEARVGYAMVFREPKEWSGFYQSLLTSGG